jgi:LPS-assembly protein
VHKKFFILCLILNVIFGISLSYAQGMNDNSLAEQLGWVYAPQSENPCGGYYLEPELNITGAPILPPSQSVTSVSADSATFIEKGASTLEGHVEVTQPGRLLKSDRAIIYRDPKTLKVTAIDLFGHVNVFENGRQVVARKAHYLLTNNSGVIENVVYRITIVSQHRHGSAYTPVTNQLQPETLVAWGVAQKVEQYSQTNAQLQNVTYSTCAPTSTAYGSMPWQIVAKEINLDRASGRGTARNVQLRVDGHPFFYTPYLNFPIDNKRKTGFLFPTIGSTNTSGFTLGIPYYLNLGPNYDATLTPTIYSERGVMFYNHLRYLTESSHGEFNFNFIPNDLKFKKFQENAPENYPGQFGLPALLRASDNRYLFSFLDTTRLTSHWTANARVLNVSDDYFLENFATTPFGITENQLPRQFNINYLDDHLYFLGNVEAYKTLHPVDRQPINNIYNRLPQFIFSGNYPQFWHNFDFNFQSEEVYFTRAIGPFDVVTPPIGNRARLQPAIAYPLSNPYSFFVPNVSLNMATYSLTNPLPGTPNNRDRAIPIYNIDSGLYLERPWLLGATNYQQTLEPRIFYLYVPFVNQNTIPIFDSGIIPFNYETLFARNRFSGYDRIGDTNQVTLALTSRFINADSGFELGNASIGQIYYFKKRLVTICSIPGCNDDVYGLGANSDTESVSPIANRINVNLNPVWSVHNDGAWDPTQGQLISTTTFLQYNPAPDRVFNLGYSFLRNGDITVQNIPGNSQNNLNIISTSYSWPISRQVSSVGVFNYNISHDQPQTFLFGLQYDTCCWAARLVAGRTFTALNQDGRANYNNAFYFQWQLKGLGNIGTNNVSPLLVSSIPGYIDPFDVRYSYMR